jgi:putative FmdB family regulatory protein
MPLYEYRCANGHTFEIIRKFSDPPVETCPTCGSPVQKLMSSPAIQFKGTGWYITDYARKGGESRETKGSKESKESGEKKDSEKKDSEKKDSEKRDSEKKDSGGSKETKTEKSSSDSSSTTTSTTSTTSTNKE